MASTQIRPGDWFLRKSAPPTRWSVERIIEFPDMPPHARLVREDGHRTITVAVSVLRDTGQYVPIDPVT